MKALIAAAGLLVMPPCERPPVEYQGESAPAIVLFAHPAVVNRACQGSNGLEAGEIALACTASSTGVMLLPDPCLFSDGYAQLVCHERAHLNRADGSSGWSHG